MLSSVLREGLMERVISYIDGFNLYFGLKSSGWRRYYWLNLQSLSQNLLWPDQRLECTKYFTARIIEPPDKQKRQNTYLEALGALNEFRTYYGKYQLNPRQCRKCGFEERAPSEKMTDVQIAVELLADAYQDSFDTAILISADSDLTPPILMVRKLFPKKKIVIAFPPNRSSKELAKVAHAHFVIGRGTFAKSVFLEEVKKPDGYILKCPDRWR
jgi:uncharacterized LabA/DUF88 family protein